MFAVSDCGGGASATSDGDLLSFGTFGMDVFFLFKSFKVILTCFYVCSD